MSSAIGTHAYSMDIAEVGIRLAEERERLGYTRVAFARLLGLSTEGLRLIEQGKSDFKVNVLTSAASSGVDVQFVLTGVKSNNVSTVTKTIGFENQAISGPVSGVGFAQAGATVHIINTNNHVTRIKAETKPGEDHISLQQRSILKDLVDQVAEKEVTLKRQPKGHRAIWSSLNKHCGVNTYTLIALDDFEKARKYLYVWLGRLNASKSASSADGSAWRRSRYAYIKINSKDHEDEKSLKAYMLRNYKASSLTELSDDQLDNVYKYVAGRRSRKRK